MKNANYFEENQEKKQKESTLYRYLARRSTNHLVEDVAALVHGKQRTCNEYHQMQEKESWILELQLEFI